MRWAYGVGFAAVLAAGAGCSTAKSAMGLDEKSQWVDEARLGGLPQGELVEVNARKADLERARTAEADARRDVDAVKMRVDDAKSTEELSKVERKAAEERAKVSRREVEPGAERRTGQDEPQPQGGSYEASDLRAAEEKEEAARARVAYAESLESYARARLELAERTVGWDVARLDQASFATLQRTRPNEARRIDVSPKELAERVRSRQENVSKARASMQRRFDEAQAKFEAFQTLAGRLGPTERGEAMPDPDSLPML